MDRHREAGAPTPRRDPADPQMADRGPFDEEAADQRWVIERIQDSFNSRD